MAGRFFFQCNILYVTLQFWTMCKYIYSKKLHEGISKVKDRLMATIRMVVVGMERNKRI